MLSAKDVSIIYETLLTSPGMNDTVKIDLRMPRKNALLLTRVIELGLLAKDSEGGFLQTAGKDAIAELNNLTDSILEKAGLTEMYSKLNELQSK
ncbi:hypothetical protein [Parafilimonas sp.]|uniref:hypothetical protein n=1 Tax=Parafilimonas sp. TaxID=1969739 RepID=UPI0039E3C049